MKNNAFGENILILQGIAEIFIITQGTVLCVERGEEQLKCAYRKYYIVCIITVSHSEFYADLARK